MANVTSSIPVLGSANNGNIWNYNTGSWDTSKATGPNTIQPVAGSSGSKTGANGQSIDQLMSQGGSNHNISGSNSTGIVPQVYPGSTGSGSNQNVNTNNYGGFSGTSTYTQPFSFGGGKLGSGGNNNSQTAALGSLFSTGAGQGGSGASGSWNNPSGGLYSQVVNPTYTSNQIGGGTTTNSNQAQLNTQNQGNINQGAIDPITHKLYSDELAAANKLNIDNQNNYNNQNNQGMGLYQKYLDQYNQYANSPDNAIINAQNQLQGAIAGNAGEQALVQGDPNLSVDTQQGQAGVIQNRFAQKLPVYQAALQAAQTNRQQQLDAYGNMVTAAAPHWNGYVGMSPLNGQVINNGGTAGINGAIQAGAGYDAQGTQATNYQAGLKNLRAADGLQSGIVNTITQNGLNNTPLSAISNLRQWFAGQTSDPKQQILAQQISVYVQALGYSPDQAAAIASQKGGTIGQLLDNLRSQYEIQNNANYGSSTSNSSSSGGNTYQGYNLPYY